jgi:hypothetical protein
MRLVATLGFLACLFGVGCKPSAPVAMRELRIKMLTTPASEVGIQPSATYPRVYGVLMDWHFGEQTATVVSMADGHASVYTTTGTSGVIGGSGHESVRVAATAFVRAAQVHYDEGVPTTEYPYPAPGHTLFYLICFDGVRVIDTKTDAVADGTDKRSDLFIAGQRVLTELRSVTEKMDKRR